MGNEWTGLRGVRAVFMECMEESQRGEKYQRGNEIMHRVLRKRVEKASEDRITTKLFKQTIHDVKFLCTRTKK